MGWVSEIRDIVVLLMMAARLMKPLKVSFEGMPEKNGVLQVHPGLPVSFVANVRNRHPSHDIPFRPPWIEGEAHISRCLEPMEFKQMGYKTEEDILHRDSAVTLGPGQTTQVSVAYEVAGISKLTERACMKITEVGNPRTYTSCNFSIRFNAAPKKIVAPKKTKNR